MFMGAVAISRQDEQVLNSLQKALRLPSKSEVIRRALGELQRSVHRNALAQEIRKSVKKCSKEDMREHSLLSGAAVHRHDSE